MMRFLIPLVLLFCCIWAEAATAAEPTAEDRAFFETKIRPVLAEKCFSCHSASAREVQGGLRLDSRDGLRHGGDSGPAIVPGNAAQSLLLTALRYTDKDLAMPPKKAGGKLPEAVIADFETWVKRGAYDPRESDIAAGQPENKYDTTAARAHWAYQPLRSFPAPQPQTAAWAKNDVDRFVLARLEAAKLAPVSDAEPAALLRRLYFDLTGLPPTPAETEAFLTAWRNTPNYDVVLPPVVDALLASRAYAERWGRHWLDVARFAESSGKDVNVVFPHAWRYRDYVIDAFASDMPFDRFVQEQIAGDLLPAASDAARARQQIATGFLAVGPKSLNETNARQFAVDLADEQIDAVTQAFLGLTVACARCHDHKFDPISQRDYTALAGVFLSTETRFGTPGGVQGRNQSTLVALPTALKLPVVAAGMAPAVLREKQERLERLRQQQRSALAQRAGGRTPTDGLSNFDVVRIITQARQLETELSVVNDDGTPQALAMGTVDRPLTAPRARGPGGSGGPRPPGPGGGQGGRQLPSGFEQIADAPLFARGNIEKAGATVPRGVPALVGPGAATVPSGTSGRLELAQALVAPQNTLTARVIVNRVWHWLFGRGLVESVDNFGVMGSRPSHPELLDTVALQFRQEGWSIKRLVRTLVLSHTYRLSTTYNETCFTADPENQLLWRHAPRRLEAEELRDAMLAIAGHLRRDPPAASLMGRAGDGPIGGERNMALTEKQIAEADSEFRSLYLPVARNVQPEVLAAFDLPDGAAVAGQRSATNVPSQALFLLNSEFAARQAQGLAERVVRQEPGAASGDRFQARLALACRLVYGRPAEPGEQAAAWQLLAQHAGDATSAWTSVARGLFASAAFRLVN